MDKPKKKTKREKESSAKNEKQEENVPPENQLDFLSDSSCLETSDYYEC